MKEFIKECQTQVQNIANDIELYADNAYRCPNCGKIHSISDYGTTQHYNTDYEFCYKCPTCGADVIEYELDAVDLCDYFEDCLDIEYRIGSGREFRSVRVMVTCGGPNIYVDTASKSVELYWGNAQESHPLTAYAVAAINDYFSELYECC